MVDGRFSDNILIISMNPLSDTFNNGKTIASFFKKYPRQNLAQLYFSTTLPDSDICDKYFRISDMDILRRFLKKSDECGNEVITTDDNSKKDISVVKKVKKNQFSRLMRELLWWNRWKSDKLINWLDRFQPKIIFLVGGDNVFTYEICNFIRKRYNSKLMFFLTDDYVLPRKTISVLWWIRRNLVLKHMKDMVQSANSFITISEYMRSVYCDFFKKDSFVAVNMTDSMKDKARYVKHEWIELVYLGGLHFNRDKVLIKLAKVLKEIKCEIDRDVRLKIYSAQQLTEKEKSKLEIQNVSSFEGKVEGEDVIKVLNEADILVHVESFKRKNIYDTKLSLSTKIPEYLSVGKPILAIGPNNIASMKYLEDTAICINKPKKIKEVVSGLFLSDDKKMMEFGVKAENKYLDKHLADKRLAEFMELLADL